jgi:hypothetical protein
MDNTRDLPGYKYYVDPETGDRPAVYVAYLDLAPDPRAAVNGVVFPVESAALAELDRRERNYERRDVTPHLDPPTGGRVWTYIGTPAARDRFERGRERGAGVVDRTYFDRVRGGFAQLAARELDRFDASTDPPPLPMTALRRVETPPV